MTQKGKGAQARGVAGRALAEEQVSGPNVMPERFTRTTSMLHMHCDNRIYPSRLNVRLGGPGKHVILRFRAPDRSTGGQSRSRPEPTLETRQLSMHDKGQKTHSQRNIGFHFNVLVVSIVGSKTRLNGQGESYKGG
jgi:hypothetical protein